MQTFLNSTVLNRRHSSTFTYWLRAIPVILNHHSIWPGPSARLELAASKQSDLKLWGFSSLPAFEIFPSSLLVWEVSIFFSFPPTAASSPCLVTAWPTCSAVSEVSVQAPWETGASCEHTRWILLRPLWLLRHPLGVLPVLSQGLDRWGCCTAAGPG